MHLTPSPFPPLSLTLNLFVSLSIYKYTGGDPEVTANIYGKSRNLPNTDTQNNSTDLR